MWLCTHTFIYKGKDGKVINIASRSDSVLCHISYTKEEIETVCVSLGLHLKDSSKHKDNPSSQWKYAEKHWQGVLGPTYGRKKIGFKIGKKNDCVQQWNQILKSFSMTLSTIIAAFIFIDVCKNIWKIQQLQVFLLVFLYF